MLYCSIEQNYPETIDLESVAYVVHSVHTLHKTEGESVYNVHCVHSLYKPKLQYSHTQRHFVFLIL